MHSKLISLLHLTINIFQIQHLNGLAKLEKLVNLIRILDLQIFMKARRYSLLTFLNFKIELKSIILGSLWTTKELLLETDR